MPRPADAGHGMVGQFSGSGVLVPLWAVISPTRAFAAQAQRPQPGLVVATVLTLTLLSACLGIPLLRAAIETAPVAPFSAAFVDRLLWVNALVLTPLGAGAYLFATALLLWTFSLLCGYDIPLSRGILIAYVAGITDALERLFVIAVLTLRALRHDLDPSQTVLTGLDAVLVAAHIEAPRLEAILSHLGLFQIWFVILLGTGLITVGQMRPRAAVVTALLAFGVLAVLRIGLDLFGR